MRLPVFAAVILFALSCNRTASVAERDKKAEDKGRTLIAKYLDEVWNKKNFALAAEKYWSDSFYNALAPELPHGSAGMMMQVKPFIEAFPDVRAELIDCVSGPGKIAARIRFTGTHLGTFFGIPPTRKKISIEEFAIIGINREKFEVIYPMVDLYALFTQLGRFPAP